MVIATIIIGTMISACNDDGAGSPVVDLIKSQSEKDSQKMAELEAQLVKLSDFVGVKVFRDSLKDGGFTPEMVMIAAGSFRMGGGESNEKPVHNVSVDRFAMGKYEVTFAEYDKFAEATGRKKPNDQGWGRGNRPVINVSWHDATAYAKWLSNQTGFEANVFEKKLLPRKEYRLPTEAEWEYAARAGTSTKYWWGNEIDKSKANYGNNIRNTSPVGNYKANKFGLYDVLGNVWGWTCSEYKNNYNGKQKQCVTNDSRLSFRGGSWYINARSVRSAYRYGNMPTPRAAAI